MTRRKTIQMTCGLWFLCWFLPFSQGFAQGSRSLAGVVNTDKGVTVPGATVALFAGAGNKLFEQLTALDGSFTFSSVPAGIYRISVEIVGFREWTKDGLDADAAESRNLVIKLEPLPPPPPPRAISRTQTTQQEPNPPSFSEAQVTDLPGLNLFQLEAGQGVIDGAPISAQQDNLLLITGNTASLDAGSMNDPGFRQNMMEAARMMGYQMREFEPGTEGGRGGPGGFGGGEFGFGGPGGGGPGGGGPGGGGGFFAMGRGRGSSFQQPKIQGMLSETFSNSALNARNYSLTGQTLPKPVLIQNDYGLTLGGVLPFFKTQSTTTPIAGMGRAGGGRRGGVPGWTFSYSGNRNRSAQDILTTVPTTLERKGDFSDSYVQIPIFDPATGERSVVNQPVRLYLDPKDPASAFTKINEIDPIANQLLKFIPEENIPCAAGLPCVNNYALQRSLPTESDQIQAAVTGLRLSSHDNLGVNYSMRRGSSLNAAIFPGLDTTRENFAQNVVLSGTHMFRARLIANWRLTLNRTRVQSTNSFAYKHNIVGDLGMTGVSQEPINWGPPTINFTNYGDISLASPALTRNQALTISGGLNRIGSKYSLQFGGDVAWNQRNSRADPNARGTYAFTGYATVLLDDQERQVPGTGSDFADFLLSLPYSTSRRYVDPAENPYGSSVYLRNRTGSLFALVNWRAKSNLTLNLGLRYEYTGPSFEKFDRMVTLDAARGFTSVEQVFPGETGPLSGLSFSRSLVRADRNNFAPRIGIAWKPTNQSRFVLRAGYGMGYNAGGYASIAGQLTNQPPFAVTQNLASNREDPLTLKNGFPTDPALTILNTFAIDPNYRPSYAQQWSFDIQTQVSRLYVLNIGYAGARGTGLDILRAPARASNSTNFIFQTNGANSIYHALNVQLMRRFSRGFNLTSSYTLSKSIDDSSGSGGSGVAQNDLNLAAERSLSSQDRRHNFQTNFVYDLPMGQNRKFFAGASAKMLNLISGWTFNGSLSIASGSPLTARYASSSGSGAGVALYNSLRADATGLPVSLDRSERSVVRFFNSEAFAIPKGAYGTAGRNTITGPGSIQLNLALQKSFRLDENNRRLAFSWRVQNLLNHPNWGGLNTTVNALSFGQVTSVLPMRSMTMSLRLNF